jgi:hypothetical protein
MARYLHQSGYKWVAFTGTTSLLNSFVKLRLDLSVLAPANPHRLADKGAAWGSYYDTDPKVMLGHIAAGYAQLAK